MWHVMYNTKHNEIVEMTSSEFQAYINYFKLNVREDIFNPESPIKIINSGCFVAAIAQFIPVNI